ncbi:MAG: hypothetical protein R3F33_11005 [Planctomycetota bacterium]
MSETRIDPHAILGVPGPAAPRLISELPPDLVDLSLACFYTGHKQKTLITMARRGEFPTIYAVGRGSHRVSAAEFSEWFEDSKIVAGDGLKGEISRFRQPTGFRKEGRNAL